MRTWGGPEEEDKKMRFNETPQSKEAVEIAARRVILTAEAILQLDLTSEQKFMLLWDLAFVQLSGLGDFVIP